MILPDCNIITWIKPETTWGHFKVISTSSENNSVAGIYQSFSVLELDATQWNPLLPYSETHVTPQEVSPLLALASRLSVPLFKSREAETSVSISYGLTIDRLDYMTTVSWSGAFEEQTEALCELWMMVDMLVDRPLVPHQY